MIEALTLIFSYIWGSIPTAYIVAKILYGEDIRNIGSKNVGALNLYRLSVEKGRSRLNALLISVPVALFDALKPVVTYTLSLIYTPSVSLLVPFLTILGHNYPVWLSFKGGRGVAALYGFLFFFNKPLFLLTAFLQGVVVLYTKRFATGMITALIAAPVLYYFFFGPLHPVYVLSELPVWMRYREKYQLMISGKLEVGY